MANNPTQLTILQDEIRRRYDTLSKRLKQVARYILDNSNSVAFDTVASIAQQADVPPSTLIRFANAFGFSGFNEMKQMFKQFGKKGKKRRGFKPGMMPPPGFKM